MRSEGSTTVLWPIGHGGCRGPRARSFDRLWSIAVLSGLGVAVVAQWPDRWVCADGSGLTSGSLAGAGDRLPVSLVSAVFTDGLDLVVIDTSGRQWCRVRPEQDAARIGDALAGLGYPWRGVDPYAASFRPWTPGRLSRHRGWNS